jgi:hypothetical protein
MGIKDKVSFPLSLDFSVAVPMDYSSDSLQSLAETPQWINKNETVQSL